VGYESADVPLVRYEEHLREGPWGSDRGETRVTGDGRAQGGWSIRKVSRVIPPPPPCGRTEVGVALGVTDGDAVVERRVLRHQVPELLRLRDQRSAAGGGGKVAK